MVFLSVVLTLGIVLLAVGFFVGNIDFVGADEKIDKILEEAGIALRQPGCSACLAMNDDKVPEGKYSVSTTNRNFEGRQGPGSRTMLASPLTAAAAAITGKLTDPRDFL